jgi:hypothetical protein
MPEDRSGRYETLDDGPIVQIMDSRAEARDVQPREATEEGVRAGR